jgi:hypothetical protein
MCAYQKGLRLRGVTLKVSDDFGESIGNTLMKLPEPFSLGGRDVCRDVVLIQVSEMRVQDVEARWSWMFKVCSPEEFAARH